MHGVLGGWGGGGGWTLLKHQKLMLCELILLNYLTDGHNVTPPQQMGYNQATRIYVGTKKKLTNHVESLS